MVGFTDFAYGFILTWLLFSGRAAGETSLARRARNVLGPLGTILVILAAANLAAVMAVTILDFSEFFTTVMPTTPKAVFWASLLLLSTVTLLHGIEVLGRVGFILLPVVLLFVSTGILGSAVNLVPSQVAPVLERGIKTVIFGSIARMSYLNDLLALGFLGVFLGGSIKDKRYATYKGQLLIGVLFVVISIFLVGVLGQETAVRQNFKLFEVFRNAGSFGPGSAGFESLFVAVWVTLFYLKISIVQGAVGTALADVFRLPAKYFYVGAAIATFLVILIAFPTRIQWVNFYIYIYPLYSLPLLLGFLVLLNLFPAKKGKKNKREANQKT